MPVIFPSGYALPSGDRPLDHARIAHAGNWISGSPAASSVSALEIYDVTAPANDALFEKWKPASLPATWDLGALGGVTLDYCAIAAHDLGATGATVSVELEVSGVGWVIVKSGFVPTSDAPILILFEPVSNVIAARISISGSAPPAIGWIRFGVALQMETRATFPGRVPFALARARTVSANVSIRGNPLAQILARSGRSLSFKWTGLTEAWVVAELPAFLSAIEAAPFLIAERPGDYPEDVALCWLAGERPRPPASGSMDLHDLTLSAEALDDG